MQRRIYVGLKGERVSVSLFFKKKEMRRKKSGWNFWKVRGVDGWTVCVAGHHVSCDGGWKKKKRYKGKRHDNDFSFPAFLLPPFFFPGKP